MSSSEEQIAEIAAQVDKIHRALFEEPPHGGKSFIERTADVVNAAERGSWAVKWSVRIIIGLGAVVGAIGVIWQFGGK